MADDAMVSIAGSQDLQVQNKIKHKKKPKILTPVSNLVLLQDQFGLSRDQAGFGLNAFSISGTLIADKCPKGKVDK